MAEEPEELARRSLNGDQAALRAFLEHFENPVYSLCLRMLRHPHDAEDAAQEALLRMVRYLKSWDPEQPIQPWVMKIASNRCRTALSKQKPATLPDFQHLPDEPVPDPSWGLAEILEEELQRLDLQPRECFILFYYNELSIADISEIMEVSIGTIKTWLHRSRKKLAEHLRQRGVNPENY